jgi:hypothetical protein
MFAGLGGLNNDARNVKADLLVDVSSNQTFFEINTFVNTKPGKYLKAVVGGNFSYYPCPSANTVRKSNTIAIATNTVSLFINLNFNCSF